MTPLIYDQILLNCHPFQNTVISIAFSKIPYPFQKIFLRCFTIIHTFNWSRVINEQNNKHHLFTKVQSSGSQTFLVCGPLKIFLCSSKQKLLICNWNGGPLELILRTTSGPRSILQESLVWRLRQKISYNFSLPSHCPKRSGLR